MRTQVPLLIYVDKSQSMSSAPCNITVTATQMCKRTIFPHSLPALKYRGADKSLARPGRKQATATEDFDFHISYL